MNDIIPADPNSAPVTGTSDDARKREVVKKLLEGVEGGATGAFAQGILGMMQGGFKPQGFLQMLQGQGQGGMGLMDVLKGGGWGSPAQQGSPMGGGLVNMIGH